MKYIILDSNIILNLPEVLSYRKKDTKLIIPFEVLQDLRKISNSRQEDLLNLIDRAEEEKIIEIGKTNDLNVEMEKMGGKPVSFSDFLLTRLAKSLHSEGKDVIVATDDKLVINYAKINDLKVFSSKDLVMYFGSNSSNDSQIKNEANKIEKKEKWSILLNFVLSILFLIGFVFFIRNYANLIDDLANVFWIILLIILGFLLFEIREKRKQLYGFVEIGFGILTLVIVFYPGLILSNWEFYFKICAGLYVIVRGLDNVYKGSENRRLGTILNKLFKF